MVSTWMNKILTPPASFPTILSFLEKMSHLDLIAGDSPSGLIARDTKESVKKLDDVRYNVDSQEERMLHDKDLNPTLTFEEGWHCNNSCRVHIFSPAWTRYCGWYGSSLGCIQLYYVDVSRLQITLSSILDHAFPALVVSSVLVSSLRRHLSWVPSVLWALPSCSGFLVSFFRFAGYSYGLNSGL